MTASISPPVLHGPGLTDVRMMVVAHGNFRRELGLSARAVRAAVHGDRRRRRVVAAHVELFLGLLHHHHSIEDDLLWAKLLDRVPAELAPLIHLMESQHEGVSALLTRAEKLLSIWRSGGDPADGAALADALDAFCQALFEHLHAEETHVLPIMAREITPQEWEEFTARGMESIPKRLTFVGFGMMRYEGDPEAIAAEVAKLPAPVRLLLPVLGDRAFRRYARAVHGTPTPPRGIGRL